MNRAWQAKRGASLEHISKPNATAVVPNFLASSRKLNKIKGKAKYRIMIPVDFGPAHDKKWHFC